MTRQERQAETRTRLLTAAGEVFVARGFHGASVEEIADAAGYTRGAFYSNFESKDEIFLAVFDRRLRDRIDEIADVLRTSPSLSEAMSTLSDRPWAGVKTWMVLTTEFWLYAMRQPELRPRLAEISRIEREAYAAAIEEQFAARDVTPPAPVEDLATIVQALDHHLPKMHAVDPDGVRDGFYYEAINLLLDAGVALARRQTED